MKDKTIIVARILFVLYLIAVAYLCFWHFTHIQGKTLMFLGLPADKTAHFLMFLPFPVLLYYSFGRRFRKPWTAIAFCVFAMILGGCLAAATELGQSLLPYRVCDYGDFMADGVGLAVSSLAVFIINLHSLTCLEKKQLPSS